MTLAGISAVAAGIAFLVSGACIVVFFATDVGTWDLTALGKLDWLLSARIGAFGFGGFLVWMTSACVLVLRRSGLPDALAWFGLGAVAVMTVAVALSIRFVRTHGSFSGEAQPSAGMWVVVGVAFLCVPAWTICLGQPVSELGGGDQARRSASGSKMSVWSGNTARSSSRPPSAST